MLVCYVVFVFELYYDDDDENYVGGLFWDGCFFFLQDQVGILFLNFVEMGNRDKQMVVEKVKWILYYDWIVQIYGEIEYVDFLFVYVMDVLVVYQVFREINFFIFKYDVYKKGNYQLIEQEVRGKELFKDKGQCVECYILDCDKCVYCMLFIDYIYDNLGILKLLDYFYYKVVVEYFLLIVDLVDLGLGVIVNVESENGKFCVFML